MTVRVLGMVSERRAGSERSVPELGRLEEDHSSWAVYGPANSVVEIASDRSVFEPCRSPGALGDDSSSRRAVPWYSRCASVVRRYRSAQIEEMSIASPARNVSTVTCPIGAD
jgi:hypothetical protein